MENDAKETAEQLIRRRGLEEAKRQSAEHGFSFPPGHASRLFWSDVLVQLTLKDGTDP